MVTISRGLSGVGMKASRHFSLGRAVQLLMMMNAVTMILFLIGTETTMTLIQQWFPHVGITATTTNIVNFNNALDTATIVSIVAAVLVVGVTMGFSIWFIVASHSLVNGKKVFKKGLGCFNHMAFRIVFVIILNALMLSTVVCSLIRYSCVDNNLIITSLATLEITSPTETKAAESIISAYGGNTAVLTQLTDSNITKAQIKVALYQVMAAANSDTRRIGSGFTSMTGNNINLIQMLNYAMTCERLLLNTQYVTIILTLIFAGLAITAMLRLVIKKSGAQRYTYDSGDFDDNELDDPLLYERGVDTFTHPTTFMNTQMTPEYVS